MSRLHTELTEVLELMIDHPDELVLDEVPTRQGEILFEAEVAQSDAGKVIGRQGRTIRALRHLLELRGAKEDRRYGFEVIDL
ncbi:MAG: KH domain-containing protein [Acidobacteria bacterium]|nr:KH domain-containing protein [Acidobacteriota bacterium]